MVIFVPEDGWDSKIVVQERFNPFLTVQSYQTPREAILLANSTNYGLRCSIWTKDPEVGTEMANKISAGAVILNGAHTAFDISDFGGIGDSSKNLSFRGRKEMPEEFIRFIKRKKFNSADTVSVSIKSNR